MLVTFTSFVVCQKSHLDGKDFANNSSIVDAIQDNNELADSYSEKNLDSSIYFLMQNFALLQKSKDDVQRGNVCLKLGDKYIQKNELDSAKVYYRNARENLLQTDSLYNYVKSSIRLGNIYLAQNDHIKSLKLYQECQIICKENDFSDLSPHLYNNLGLLYKEIEDYEDAQVNFQTAFELFEKNNDEVNSVYPLYNIALIQSITGKNKEAIDGYLALTSYHLKTENWLSLAYIYNAISEIYYRNKDYELGKKISQDGDQSR